MPVVKPRAPTALEQAFARLKPDGPVALAVSGGADSTALMLLSARLLGKTQQSVLTVDHGLRAQALSEAKSVRSWARELGLAHVILRWQGEKPLTGLQAAARRARYDLMTNWCRANGVSVLLTAHTLNDQAETVLMRLKRGSGVDGLSGIPAQGWWAGVRLLRPLLGADRSELTALLLKAGQPWIEDPSNEDERFERVQIRKNWKKLDEMGLSQTQLVKIAQKMTRARTALDSMTQAFLRNCAQVFDLGYCMLDPDQLLDQTEEIAMRALSRCLQAIAGADWPPRDKPLERLLHWIREKPSRSHTLGGCRLVFTAGGLAIAREAGRIDQKELSFCNQKEILWDGRFQISCKGAADNVCIGPLRQSGWAELKPSRPDLPAFIGHTLPAIRQDGAILAVPSIGYVSPQAGEKASFSAVFANHNAILGR